MARLTKKELEQLFGYPIRVCTETEQAEWDRELADLRKSAGLSLEEIYRSLTAYTEQLFEQCNQPVNEFHRWWLGTATRIAFKAMIEDCK